MAHSVIDNLKIQNHEEKGSPVSPSNNHVALLLFMLSHYVADAHMPFHCDDRSFSMDANLHGYIEEEWEKTITDCFSLDKANERFIYDKNKYPHIKSKTKYNNSFLLSVDNKLQTREFLITYGTNNNDVLDFMNAVCQYSYLLSYDFIPEEYDETNVDLTNWLNLPGQRYDYSQLSLIVFSDAIDSIARVWFRVWRRYMEWLTN